ncbi:related to sterigmatocystin biosynthesis P450 monooxygenase STCS [Cephalotrichum gorgonifer]|uniref:Related to sterigmatocystin biosynthesis P450 monooxygenase STCS n=1 Tax=Cephalotrichum gorgonifer TaxID=2041049 RepID=A0AAE8MZ70_9PEZI|nr:related to sterigmatocystin biosynthesis P450 monooxygenase STCS [Cephalotrichum gorgonifer]
MPSWNPLLGNLLAAGKVFDRLPADSHSCYMLRMLSLDFPDGAYYLDVWPMMDPLLVITDPDMSYSAETHPQVGATKPPSLQGWFHPISGGPSQSDLNGRPWRYLRDLFSPAFSNSNVNAMAPVIVDRIEIFRQILREKAASGVERFPLEPAVLSLINDMICETLLGMNSDVQRQGHPLTEAMMRQLRMKFTEYNPANLLSFFNPVGRYRLWNNSRILDAGMKAQLQSRFDAYRSDKAGQEARVFKPLIDIAIEDYLRQPGNVGATSMDPDFLAMMARNMRAAFFVGYDSTASAILFCYYTLWKHPDVLARVRAEHDVAFGPDIDSVPRQIVERPQALSALPYTLAVIKETMRLFPVANGIRDGSPDFEVVDAKGNRYPTEGFQVVISHYSNHMNPKAWPRPEEFIPDRWLVEPGHELYPPAKGWRPFAHGPRACPGQQQVMTEIKAVLACTVREFDIKECYDEVDAGKKKRPDLAGVAGYRPYMIDAGAAHPTGQYPCRVTLSGYTPTSS